ITAGAFGALELIGRILLDPDDGVWVEDPGHFFSRDILLKTGAGLTGVRVDGEGLDVADGIERAAHAKLAVVTPTHQFPSGAAMSAARRLALLDWAERQQAWIVEDDYDWEFHH